MLDKTLIRFDTKLYRQVDGIPMDTNCAPLVANLLLFCYERDFMMSLSDDKQADIIDAFHTTSRYLDDILNLYVHFDNMVKVRKTAKIRNQYNQLPHLTLDTTWESDENTKHHQQEPRDQPFPSR